MQASVPLESDLREEAFHLFVRLIARSDPGRLEAWAALGLTMTQLRVLFILRAEDGLAARDLAERLGVTPSTLTRVMDRLVRHRLVRREPDDDDRRLVRHYLTPSGLDVRDELERTGRARMNEIFRHLTCEQLERVVSALRDLTAATDDAEAHAARALGV